jgi:hypothetical protein
MSTLNRIIAAETMRTHRARWFVWAGGQKMPHTASMRGMWGWDAECSCGDWESRTGGATRAYVAGELWNHRYEAQCSAGGESVRFCPHDNEPLLPQGDNAYICMACGDEWHEDHFRALADA